MANFVATRLGVGMIALGTSLLWGASAGSPAASAGDGSTTDPAGSVAVTVAPTEVTLTPGATTQVTVIISNAGASKETVKVDAVASDNSIQIIQPSDSLSTQPVLQPKSSIALRYAVTRGLDGTGQTQGVQFIATGVDDNGVPNVASGSLAVNVAKTADLLAVAITPDLKELQINEYRPADTAIVITNQRSDPITIASIDLTVPEQVTATVTCPDLSDEDDDKVYKGGETGDMSSIEGCVKAITARSQAVIPVRLEVGDTLTPGSRTLTASVTAATRQDTDSSTAAGSADSTTVAANTSFKVEVFAESDILKAIGVPIFLLLPGAIIVLSCTWLISKATGWRHALTGPPKPEFNTLSLQVLISLAVSLGFAVVYPHATAALLPGTERDYLRTQGFSDFYYVILWAFIAAAAVWGFAELIYLITKHWYVLREGDSVKDVLRKVKSRSRFGKPIQYVPVIFGEGDRDKGLRVRGPNAAKTELVIPKIVYTPPTDQDDQACHDAAKDYEDNPTSATLRQLVKTCQLLKGEEIHFYQGDVPAPREVASGQVKPVGVYLQSVVFRKPDGSDGGGVNNAQDEPPPVQAPVGAAAPQSPAGNP